MAQAAPLLWLAGPPPSYVLRLLCAIRHRVCAAGVVYQGMRASAVCVFLPMRPGKGLDDVWRVACTGRWCAEGAGCAEPSGWQGFVLVQCLYTHLLAMTQGAVAHVAVTSQ